LLFRKLSFNQLFEKAQLFENAQGPLGQLSFLRNSAFQKTQLLSAFEGNPGISFEKTLSFYQLLGPLCSYRAFGKLSFLCNSALQKTQLLSAFCEGNG